MQYANERAKQSKLIGVHNGLNMAITSILLGQYIRNRLHKDLVQNVSRRCIHRPYVKFLANYYAALDYRAFKDSLIVGLDLISLFDAGH